MAERELMHWAITVVLPVAFSLFAVWNGSKNRTEILERRLTKLEVLNNHQNKILDSHDIRLARHEEEQKVMVKLIEQIKNLTKDINNLRHDLRSIENKEGK